MTALFEKIYWNAQFEEIYQLTEMQRQTDKRAKTTSSKRTNLPSYAKLAPRQLAKRIYRNAELSPRQDALLKSGTNIQNVDKLAIYVVSQLLELGEGDDEGLLIIRNDKTIMPKNEWLPIVMEILRTELQIDKVKAGLANAIERQLRLQIT